MCRQFEVTIKRFSDLYVTVCMFSLEKEGMLFRTEREREV